MIIYDHNIQLSQVCPPRPNTAPLLPPEPCPGKPLPPTVTVNIVIQPQKASPLHTTDEQPTLNREQAAQRNVVPHASQVTQAQRAAALGQRAITVWLTGLSGSGKSTLATEFERQLVSLGHACYMLDGDNVRTGINRDLAFGHEDRSENIRRIAEVARLMNDAGLIVVTAFISPYREDRRMARTIIGVERFVEVFLDTPLNVCEQRDPKGLYRKARKGEIPEFTGISAPYETPEHPELVLSTGTSTVDACMQSLIAGIVPQIRLP